jgi:hypothetical protein
MSGTSVDPTTYPSTAATQPTDVFLLGRPVTGAPTSLLGITAQALAAALAGYVGTIQGVAGQVGPAGAQGIQGPAGPAGATTSISLSPLAPVVAPANFVGVSVNGQDQRVALSGLIGAAVDGSSLQVNPATGLLSVGNVSAGQVLATGSSTSRALNLWLSDIPSVMAWGANSSGVIDSSTAFSNAVTNAQSLNKLAFLVPPGTYSVTSLPTFSGVVPAMFAIGAELAEGSLASFGQAPGSFIGNAQASGLTLMRMLTGPVNQSAMVIEATMGASSATAPYEKMGLYVNVQSLDASNYSTNLTKDCVGAQFNATAGVSDSRVWGGSISVTNPAGVIGNLCGLEIDVNNLGASAIPNISTPGGQSGLLIVSLGSNSPTNGALITSNNGAQSAFGYGFVVKQNAVANYAFYYGDQATSPYFSVSATGAVQSAASGSFASLNISGSISANQASANENFTAPALVAIGSSANLNINGGNVGGYANIYMSGAGNMNLNLQALGSGTINLSSSVVINPGNTLTLGNAAVVQSKTSTRTVTVLDSTGATIELLAA